MAAPKKLLIKRYFLRQTATMERHGSEMPYRQGQATQVLIFIQHSHQVSFNNYDNEDGATQSWGRHERSLVVSFVSLFPRLSKSQMFCCVLRPFT